MKIADLLRDRPLIFWAVVFLAVPAIAAVLPLDWSAPEGKGIFEMKPKLSPFSDRVVEIDRNLAAGRSVELPRKRWQKIRPMLQARRLTQAGPMSQGEVRRAMDLLTEMNRQIAREPNPDSKAAVRTLWHDRLADELPRLHADRIGPALEKLRGQVEGHLTIAKK